MIKHIPKKALHLILIFCALAGAAKAQQHASGIAPEELKKEFEEALTTKLLNLWYPKAVDQEEGGFFSTFTYDWQLAETQNKMIVTQARHVWTCAKAAAFFPEDSSMYRQAAAHGFRFLKEKMWDDAYGGFYNLVNRRGDPLTGEGYDRYKRTYGNAFGIYALAAYYDLSHAQEALDLVKQAFTWLDRHAHDDVYGGYFSSLTREGQVVMEEGGNDVYENIQLLNKEQNTSIHLLEAFTELYKVWPDTLVEKRLKELLQEVRDTMTTERGYLQLYFYRDWTPVSLRDSSEAVRKAHPGVDYVSFGHDIETAFLMLEASEALGKFEWDKTMKKAKIMVDHTVAHGFDPQRSGIYDGGYYFKGTDTLTIINKNKNWWSQAEGLNALLLYSKLYPEQQEYKQDFLKLWEYVQQYIIDQEHGGWYPDGIDTDPEAKHAMKGQIWKSAYHDGRAMMNIIRMLEGKDTLSAHP